MNESYEECRQHIKKQRRLFANKVPCSQGLNFSGRNINNLIYADETTLMVKRKEVLRSLLMKVKETSEKFGLKLNILKMKIMAHTPSHQCK